MCQRRVLLARIKGEVRQVQVCKWTTTIEGSLEPLCRLTHSIIQARRCRRVTMRSRILVSTSNRALASCPDVKGEGDTHVERCVGLHACKLQRYCQGMLCFEVGDGFDLLVQVQEDSAKVSVGLALPHPVSHLLCNRQVLRVVLDDTRCQGSRTQRPPPPGRPPPLQSPGAARGTRWPLHSPPASEKLCRGCSRQTKLCSASKSARRSQPPWLRAPALPRPASRQHHQAALASSTCASGPPSASLPCGCQHEQRACTRLCPAFHALIWQQQRERVRVWEGERR